MRQKDDTKFSNALSNFRTNDYTEEDAALIQSRCTTQDSLDYPTLALHIFAGNVDVDAHNTKIIEGLGQTIITIVAEDAKKDKETGHISNITLKEKESGLMKTLKVCIGARVMMTSNFNVLGGLVNSACGTIAHFSPPIPEGFDPNNDNFVPRYIWVKFDVERVGAITRGTFVGIAPDTVSTPVEIYEASVRKGVVSGTRRQFP